MYIHMVVLILNNCWHQVASVHYLARPPTPPIWPIRRPKMEGIAAVTARTSASLRSNSPPRYMGNVKWIPHGMQFGK